MMVIGLLALLPFQQTARIQDGDAAWRSQLNRELTDQRGWLSLAGLFWLKSGVNTVGSAENSAVRLPSPAPAHLGNLVMVDGTVSLSDPADGVLVNGKAPQDKPLTLDLDVVSSGPLSFMVIQRGDKTGVRLWDDDSEARRTFKGREWYAYKPEYVVSATFVPYKPARELPILNVLGQTTMVPNPGYLTFLLHGKMCRLETQAQGEGFFLNFTDATTGKATYGAGRFLDTGAPKDGKVVINFNRAYSPPCAFTSFATCPLPPKANRMSVAVEAGERGLGHAH